VEQRVERGRDVEIARAEVIEVAVGAEKRGEDPGHRRYVLRSDGICQRSDQDDEDEHQGKRG